MEIGGRIKLPENVHNIWISARKPVVCPQTRYRTRRNIVPKFLKNATKTIFAFCVFNNGRIYLSIPRKAKTCMLFRSNAHKNSRNFRVCIIISSVHIRVEHSILRAPKSLSRSHFLCTTWVPACPNSESVSNLQRGDLLRKCSFGLFGVQFDERKTIIFFEELSLCYQCKWRKNVYISHLLSLSQPHTGLNRPHRLHKWLHLKQKSTVHRSLVFFVCPSRSKLYSFLLRFPNCSLKRHYVWSFLQGSTPGC